MVKAWTVVERFSTSWKYKIFDKKTKQNKTGILPNCTRFCTVVWMHCPEFDKAFDEKSRRKIQMDVANCFEQILVAPPKKTTVSWHELLISKPIQVTWEEQAWHWWKRKDRLISDVFMDYYAWKHRCPYIHLLFTDTGVVSRTYLVKWSIGTDGDRIKISFNPLKIDIASHSVRGKNVGGIHTLTTDQQKAN